ncbi:MAG: tetratricopeptide repeat protein [Verrucomicrobiae bacterium]|nr:tetratricopeptide repeat protein [Verrucomicrobiae bacterium]
MRPVFCTVVVAAWALAACREPATTGYVSDDQNPLLKKAEMERQRQNYPEAAECYEQALKLNPDSAGIHWAAATLYEQRLGDFGSAIYHYQRFKKLSQDKEQTTLVDVSIERAKRELGKSLLGAAGGTNEVAELSKKIRALEEERNQLRQQLDQANLLVANQPKVAASAPVAVAEPSALVPVPTPASARPVARPPSAATAPPVQPAAPPSPPAAQVASAQPPAAAPVEPARPAVGPTTSVTGPKKTMHYTVKPGDTLSSISRRFYGDASAAELIYRANKTFIPDKNRLLPGTELALPPRRGR